MAEFRTFRTNPIRELGISHAQAESQILQVALQAPSKYFALRTGLLRALLERQVQTMYNTVWFCLGSGTDPDGNNLIPFNDEIQEIIGDGADHYAPALPEEEINRISMSLAQGYRDLVERLMVERVLPKKLYDLATQKVAAKTNLSLISGEGV
jgi:hypothetical protein